MSTIYQLYIRTVYQLAHAFNLFSEFSSPQKKFTKCEMTGVGVLSGNVIH